MLRCLEGVRNGTVNPESLYTAECTKRAFSLELSKYGDVERGHSGGVNALDIEVVDGRYLLSGGSNGTLVIHDLDNLSGQPKHTCPVISKIDRSSRYAHRHSVETVQWYPHDTGLFTSSGMDRQLKVWDTNTAKPAEVFQLKGLVYQHHMSPIATKHCLIAVGSSTSHVILVDLKSGSSSHELRGHQKGVLAVRWSPREEYQLVTGGCDNKILMWDIRTAKGFLKALDQHNGADQVASPKQARTAHDGHVNGLCFTPDGLFLVSYGTDNRVRIWNTFTGKNEMVNFGKVYNESRRSMRFDTSHHSNPKLIYVPSDSNIVVFDTQSGMKVNTLLGHYNSVNCCTFHPFRNELYSGANDRNLLIWTPDSEQTRAYDEYLHGNTVSQNAPPSEKTFFKRNVTADAWSSDEAD